MLKSRKGQLLLEVLFTIAVAGIILGVGANLVLLGLRSNKVSIERETAQGLADEAIEAIRANAFERWTCGTPAGSCSEKFIYDLNKGSSNLYYPVKDSDTDVAYKWVNHTPSGSARWGTSSVDVKAVSALSPRSVWIGTSTGEVWQWNGEIWSNRNYTGGSVSDIATVSENEVWVVGGSGNVWKWNGSSWGQHSGTGRWGINTISAVSAPLSNRVWIAGDGGNLWRYDGTIWLQFTGIGWLSTDLKGVSALGDHVWVVGNDGHVWHYNGTTWTQHSGSGRWGVQNITGVSFLSSAETWLSTDSGGIWKYNGSNWSSYSGAWGSNAILNISAFSSKAIYMIEGVTNSNLWGYNGTTWARVPSSGTNPWGSSVALKDLSDRFSTSLWIVGASGNVWELRGARWKIDTTGTESVAVPNGITYTRSFYVQYVCRNDSTNEVSALGDSSGTAAACTESPSGDSWDPSTMKVTATVSWGGDSISQSEYITRWLSGSCLQTQWTPPVVGSVVRSCPTTDYDSATTMSTGVTLSISNTLLNGRADLTSAVFDTTLFSGTGANTGARYNFIRWEGANIDSDDQIWIQIAASDSASGGWTYYGDDAGDGTCGSGEWFKWSGAASPGLREIKCQNLDNKRFFKYKVQLCLASSCSSTGSLTDTSPQLNNIIITWSP